VPADVGEGRRKMGRKVESQKIEERMKTERQMEMKAKKNERIYSSQFFTRGGTLKCSSVL
jgi:hypothetical protein